MKIKGFKSKKFPHAKLDFGPRRADYYDINSVLEENSLLADEGSLQTLKDFDIVYRTICAILFNFVPKSGHPGGSISSGHIVSALLYQTMDYDLKNPKAQDADHLCYAAGHKALGLYAAWALRNECAQISAPELLPQENLQLRLEDLLGFRRNPVTKTPLYTKYNSKSLDGHPTPQTPFVRLATGASGVGVSTAIGLGLGMLDSYEKNAPYLHILEGEGGLTPGRVSEAMAIASSGRLKNVIMHIDWNQSSIDSNHVCRNLSGPGDYVQWDPMELAFLHDWNVISVDNGFDFQKVLAAQKLATNHIENSQPTAIVYKTTKGWKYGIEGRASHGAGHDFCSNEFYNALSEFEEKFKVSFPRFSGSKDATSVEQNFYDCLMVIRDILKRDKDSITNMLGSALKESQKRLKGKKLSLRKDGPNIKAIFQNPELKKGYTPKELKLTPGESITLREALGKALGHLNRISNGAIMAASADLLGSTSLNKVVQGLPEGFYSFDKNPKGRLVAAGGICEDALGGLMAGISSFGNHIGAGSSYGAFIAALQHVTARLHAIGQEAQCKATGDEYNPFFIVCAHAGPKTGEDGPTHADPQALQLFSENFPEKAMITLTPMEPQEVWPLVWAALDKRPAIIAPFVTRPSEKILDRKKIGLPDPWESVNGVYPLRKADGKSKLYHGTLVVQGNGVGEIFLHEVLPQLDKEKINMNIFCVTSVDLFNRLSQEEQERIFPENLAREAMGLTEFTLPTMYRFVTSNEGRKRTLHTFQNGHFLGSGQAAMVLKEARLDAASQLEHILDYANSISQR